MKHLEMVRGVEEHRRGMKMSRGLASFVEGCAELVEADVEVDANEGTKIAGQFDTDSGMSQSKSKSDSIRGESITSTQTSVSSVERKDVEYSNALARTEEEILASHARTDSQSTQPGPEADSQLNSFAGTSNTHSSLGQTDPPLGDEISESSSMKIVFSRAANLIREAFEIDGGAVFYDAQRGWGNLPLHQKQGLRTGSSAEDSHTSGDELHSPVELHENQKGEIGLSEESQEVPQEASPGYGSAGDGVFSRSSTESDKRVEILGFSTADASSINADQYPGPQAFLPFDEKSLQKLLLRYPRGKLWILDSDGAVSSSSEEEFLEPQHKDPAQHAKDMIKRKARSARVKSDAKFLSTHFPGVRQLLFVPLWDSGANCPYFHGFDFSWGLSFYELSANPNADFGVTHRARSLALGMFCLVNRAHPCFKQTKRTSVLDSFW